MIKVIGAILIIGGCGGFGFLLAIRHRREEYALHELISALDYMECELQYHLTPLPELCRHTANECSGIICRIFLTLAHELENQISPDVACCMAAALQCGHAVPAVADRCLQLLGRSLGRFDLSGQLNGLESVRSTCRSEMMRLNENREVRLQNYKTLSLCMGAALAILFI